MKLIAADRLVAVSRTVGSRISRAQYMTLCFGQSSLPSYTVNESGAGDNLQTWSCGQLPILQDQVRFMKLNIREVRDFQSTCRRYDVWTARCSSSRTRISQPADRRQFPARSLT